MEKIYIVTTGCSFTDSHIKFFDSESDSIDNIINSTFTSISTLSTIQMHFKYIVYLAIELYKNLECNKDDK